MEPVSINQLLEWTEGKRKGKPGDFTITGISTNSCTVKPGELFIPLSGENFDGHSFISDALKNGASAFISGREIPPDLQNYPAIIVDNPLKAYHRIAKNYRKKFQISAVAITGSNGKTTTKDIIYNILKRKFNVLATEKNFNNEVGVPQTLMKMDLSTEVLVTELAMRGKGQIRQLGEIVEPDIALITNVGESHYELLGSYEAIALAKCEILENLNPAGCAILNADGRWFEFCARRSPAKIITFGIQNPSDIHLLSYENRGLKGFSVRVSIKGSVNLFNIPLVGFHNIYNCLASIAIADYYGMSAEEIAGSMENLTSSDKRMEVKTAPGGWIILNDTYNASPSSTRSALEILKYLPSTGKKIAILGDMLELGEIAIQSHQSIGAMIGEIEISELNVVGDLGKEIAKGAFLAGMNGGRIHHWEDRDKLISHLVSTLRGGDIVLLKGSRLMKMEEITDRLMS